MAKLSHSESLEFIRELSSITTAGLPLPEGLRSLLGSMRSQPLKQVVESVAEQVEKGASLHHALANCPVTLPDELVALGEIAELSGDPKQVFYEALQNGMRTQRYRNQFLTAIFYPMVVTVAGVSIFYFISLFIIPSMMKMYEDLGVEVSFLTKVVTSVSSAIISPLGMLCGAVILLVFLLYLVSDWMRSYMVSRINMLPGFAYLTIISDTAILSRQLSSMTRYNISLPMALKAAKLTVITNAYRNSINEMIEAAESGRNITPYFPKGLPGSVSYILEQSEERGTLPEGLEDVAQFCDDHFEANGNRLVTSVEPMLLLILGVIIAAILFGLYFPLFTLPKVVGV